MKIDISIPDKPESGAQVQVAVERYGRRSLESIVKAARKRLRAIFGADWICLRTCGPHNYPLAVRTILWFQTTDPLWGRKDGGGK